MRVKKFIYTCDLCGGTAAFTDVRLVLRNKARLLDLCQHHERVLGSMVSRGRHPLKKRGRA